MPFYHLPILIYIEGDRAIGTNASAKVAAGVFFDGQFGGS